MLRRRGIFLTTRPVQPPSQDELGLLAGVGEPPLEVLGDLPARAYLGEKWWQLDLSWYGLASMERLGLVRDVKRDVPQNPRGF